MRAKVINIVSFDNPYPPKYGGIIDVYYKIEALHKIGYQIHLHCFVKEIPIDSFALARVTGSVSFYLARPKWYHFFSSLPLSVITRSNSKLVENLIKNDAPIIFESLKSTCLMNDFRLSKRVKILRLHNVEQDYFRGIAKSESNFLRKLMFYREVSKFKKYDSNLLNFQEIFTLSNYENDYVQEKYKKGLYVPVFHGNKEVVALSEYGEYTIFHGDLSTSDNKKAALFLIEVFKNLPNYELIVASGFGKDFVLKAINGYTNIKHVELKNFSHLKDLLQKAHISISWSFQKSGTKLKLLNSIFNSRHNIVNENIIDDELVLPLCSIATNKKELIDKIIFLNKEPYTMSLFLNKREILKQTFSDEENANKIDFFLNLSNE
uniref:hypothetical protein n=1 Tax=Flavobacterium sp. TaxID=239 RepID=UPI00404B2887